MGLVIFLGLTCLLERARILHYLLNSSIFSGALEGRQGVTVDVDQPSKNTILGLDDSLAPKVTSGSWGTFLRRVGKQRPLLSCIPLIGRHSRN